MKSFDPKSYSKALNKIVTDGLNKEVEKDIKRKIPTATNIKVRTDLKSRKIIVEGLTPDQQDQLNKS